MKKSFIALCTLVAIFTLFLAACSKKGSLLNDETTAAPPAPIPAAKNDTPYSRHNTFVPIHESDEPAIIIIPAVNADTPYNRINTRDHLVID